MFGYVRPNKPELLVREFEQYKAIYCELCNELGKSFGVLSRLTLSYDCTFYALLALCVNGSKVQANKKMCRVNPLKQCTYLASQGDEYKLAAGLSVLMTYHKLKDNVKDESFFKSIFSRLGAFVFKGKYRKAVIKYPEVAGLVEDMMMDQALAESEEDVSVDRCCEPTANLLSRLCEMLSCDTLQAKALKEFGYYLGRWVYLIDASDDLADDLKSRSFNPLISRLELEEYQGVKGFCADNKELNERISLACNEMLNPNVAMMISAINLINLENFGNIVHNVIEKGMPEIQREILFLDVKERRNGRSL